MAEGAPELIADIRDRLLAIEIEDGSEEQECLEFLLAVNREGADGR